jgi:hypothetical protein
MILSPLVVCDNWPVVAVLFEEDDGEAGLVIAGVLLLAGWLDCAIAPDSASALNATPNMSLFNILASK